MTSSVQAVSELYQKEFNLTGIDSNTLFVMLGLSVFLGLAGSMLSVRRHVKEIEPK
jgi:cell division transport system permease protein